MKKISKRILTVFLVTLLTLAMAMPASAAPVRLNKKSASVTVGKTVKLKVSGTRKKVKWSSSNSKIATVNKKGIVKARKAGNVKIIAKIGKKKLTCKVRVRNVAKNNKNQAIRKKFAKSAMEPDKFMFPMQESVAFVAEVVSNIRLICITI